MTSISIPAGITAIDPAFFQLFPNAASISVASENETYQSYNGMLFGANEAQEPDDLLLVPEGMEGSAVLPSTLATVPACVFSRCIKLSAIVADFPGSTATSPFTSKDGILYTNDLHTLIAAPAGIGASVAIAPECTSIAEGAFWGNDDLATIVASGNIASILVNPRFKSDAASNADVLAEALTTDANTDTALAPVPSFMESTTANATIVTENRAAWEQAGFKNFAEQAQPGDTAEADGFAYTLLDDFTLSVRWAGEDAPEELTIPQTATINGISYSVSSIECDAFKGEGSIRVLTIPEGVRIIGTSAFEDCTSLEKTTIAGSVTSIEDAAFKGCTSLADVQLGGGLRTIGAFAFESASIANIWLPASLEQIRDRAFAANEHLEYVVAASNIQDVDPTALADCTNTEIYVPYTEDDTYSWTAGVPATGNHLIPYGVQLAEEPLTLHQDESADLLEGGSLNADGRIQVSYAYDAAPISVDTETATIKAKQTGKTTVTAHLKIDDKSLASASRTVIVALAPKPEVPEEDIVKDDEDGHDRDHDGEEGCNEGIDAPETSYTDQLFEEGDYYTSGNFEYEEKVINRSVALASMDADVASLDCQLPEVESYSEVESYPDDADDDGGISAFSLTLPGESIDSHTGTGNMGGTSKSMSLTYDSSTHTLTWEMSPTCWKTTSKCGGAVGCTTDGHTWNYRKTKNKLNSVRKLVLKNWDYKNPAMLFSKMLNLEEVVIEGNFLSNGSGVTNVSDMFSDCPQLRVIPSNMVFPSTVTTATGLFGFTSHKVDGTNTSVTLFGHNQYVPAELNNSRVLTAYNGSDSKVKQQLSGLNTDLNSGAGTFTHDTTSRRSLVSSYYTVTFDNQSGSGGHQTVGESTSASTKTYSIKVPSGSPVPELIGTPYLSGWTFGGYVQKSGNAHTQKVGTSGYPALSADTYSQMKITSNVTLTAFWYRNASFYANGGTFSSNQSWYVSIPKGYPIAKPSGFSWVGDSLGSNLWKVVYPLMPIAITPSTQAPAVTHGDRLFKGYTLATSSGDYAFSTPYYDANRNGTSQIYNGGNFYAMWGYYTISFYSNVKLDWHWNDTYRNSSGQGVPYGNSGTGTSAADYGSAFQIKDAYSYTRWNSGFFNIRNSASSYPQTRPGDPNNYAINYRDVSWTAPTGYQLDSIKLGSATGTDIPGTNAFADFVTLNGNVSIYLNFKSIIDTFTFKVNGGKWSDDTTTDKTTTARRGTAISTPGTPTRAATTSHTYSFAGWNTSSTATEGSTNLGNANGNATYYAIWTATKISYTITWKLSGTGSYWGTNTKDTADKTTSVAYGDTPSAPATPARTQTTEYTYTFKGWSPAISKVTGAATYTATWTETKREYTITWKLSGTGSHWGTNTSDTANKTTNVAYGEVPKAPATPARSQTAEYTYTFNGWTPTLSAVSGAATYTATWTETKRSYDITWVANGGYWGTNKSDTANKTSKSQTYGTKLTAPSNGVPKRDHYTFLGWSLAPSGGPSATREITVTGATTYYAIWGGPFGFYLDPSQGEFQVPDLGLSGRDRQYLWTNNFRVVGNTLRFSLVKADGTNTSVCTLDSSNVIRPGYTLSGWYIGKDSTNSSTNLGIEAGAVYMARWTENDVTVRYQVGTAGGGTVSCASETVKAQNGTLSGSIPKHAAGWHFVGWNTKADGTGTTLSTDASTAFKPAKQAVSGWDYSLNVAATYYAIFAPNTYTIELLKNDGTGDAGVGSVIATIEAAYDTPWTVRAGHVPARRGYYFLGWDTDPAYAGMTPRFEHGPGASGAFEDKTFTANLTTAEDANGNWVPTTVQIYAIWNESRYTIIFHENWGDDTTGTGTVPTRIDALYTQRITIPTNDLARTGYNFANWNTESDGTGTTYKTRTTYTHVGLDAFDDVSVRGATVHLYAQWDANQYIVQFDPNISISDPEDKGEWHIEAGDEVLLAQYGQEIPLETVFSRPGYEFVGWSFEKNVASDETDTPIVDFRMGADGTFAPATFKNLTTDKLGLVRLYAQWKGGTYTVTFDGNASDDRPVEVGPAGAMDTLSMRFGVAKTLPANTFVCKGYTFCGWNTEPDGTGTSYLDCALVQDIPGVKDGQVTLFAQWAPVLSLTSPIDACIEVYIDGMDMYVYEVRAGQSGKWPTDTPNGDGTKDDHEDQFEHGQAAIESRTPAKLFIEQIDCIPNLDPDTGMARIFPVDGTPELSSWEDFELEFTALNENTGKHVKVATEFGNSYAFVAGANNNYFIPAYDSATNTPGKLDYTLLLRIPEDQAKKPNTVRYSEGPVKIATLMFTCRVAD